MTIDWELVGFNIGRFIIAAVTLCRAVAMTLSGVLVSLFFAVMSLLPDAALVHDDASSPAAVAGGRFVLIVALVAGIVITMRGLGRLRRWFRPHDPETMQVIAQLENDLHEAEQFAAEAGAEAGQAAEEARNFAAAAEWAHDTFARIDQVFRIPGVLDAARKAARIATHPDTAPAGASPAEIRDLTERFQMAEAVFDRFSN